MYHCQTEPSHTHAPLFPLFCSLLHLLISCHRSAFPQDSALPSSVSALLWPTQHFISANIPLFTPHFFVRREEIADQTSPARCQREAGRRSGRSRFVLTGGILHSLHFQSVLYHLSPACLYYFKNKSTRPRRACLALPSECLLVSSCWGVAVSRDLSVFVGIFMGKVATEAAALERRLETRED